MRIRGGYGPNHVNGLDWELENGGHGFARSADDCNTCVKGRGPDRTTKNGAEGGT